VREGGTLFLRGMLADPDGSKVRRGERRATFPAAPGEAELLGHDLGAELRRG
jgi:hydroxymethylbilane synthase